MKTRLRVHTHQLTIQGWTRGLTLSKQGGGEVRGVEGRSAAAVALAGGGQGMSSSVAGFCTSPADVAVDSMSFLGGLDNSSSPSELLIEYVLFF